MKEKELRECATCAVCGRKIGACGMPLFWRVRIERHGIKAAPVQRQTGLAQAMGSAALAAVMGPDEEMTTPLMDPVTMTVCAACGMESTCVAVLSEKK